MRRVLQALVVAGVGVAVSACAQAAGPAAPPPDDGSTGRDDVGDGDQPDVHADGPLAGVPVTCRLAADGPPEVAAVAANLSNLLGPEFGPLVVVDDSDGVAVVGATRFTAEGTSELVAWRLGDGDPVARTRAAEVLSGSPAEPYEAEGDLQPEPIPEVDDCSWIAADAVGAGPTEPDPVPSMAPDLVVATPDPAAPGEVVELTFPTETGRGLAFQLDRADEEGWEPVAWMTSDANGGEPATVAFGTDGWAVDDVGIGGPGPDRVVLPDDLVAGAYRLCTENRGDEICTPLDVVDSGGDG